MKRVVVNIDRLVLHGIPQAHGADVARGLQEELTRALAEPGAVRRLAQLGPGPRLAAGAVPTGRADRAHTAGTAVAHAIVKGKQT